jgi:hypothetical protein
MMFLPRNSKKKLINKVVFFVFKFICFYNLISRLISQMDGDEEIGELTQLTPE